MTVARWPRMINQPALLRKWERAVHSPARAAQNQPERASVRLGNDRNGPHITQRTTAAAQWKTVGDILTGG
jgi:hypothetical protein